MLAGCDTFYHVEAVVTDCGTGRPLAKVHVSIRVEDAVGTPSPRIVELETAPDGQVEATLNQPDSVTAIVTLTNPGYEPWSNQFEGSPRERPLRICLKRRIAHTSTPSADSEGAAQQ